MVAFLPAREYMLHLRVVVSVYHIVHFKKKVISADNGNLVYATISMESLYSMLYDHLSRYGKKLLGTLTSKSGTGTSGKDYCYVHCFFLR